MVIYQGDCQAGAHRDVHAVDAVVEAPGEDQIVFWIGENVAVQQNCLQFVGLEDCLAAGSADRSICKN